MQNKLNSAPNSRNTPSMSARDLSKTGIMAALVFLATYIIKIPSINGYSHLGDCMILIGVLTLGFKKGALAGGIGAALADLFGGYMQWILPTFFIKAVMAAVMGLFIEKVMPNRKGNWLWGAVIGGIVQIFGYTSVKILYYGFAVAMTMTPGLLIQTAAGISLTAVFVSVLSASGIVKTTHKYEKQINL